jgi:purine-cytosine permease-like protein
MGDTSGGHGASQGIDEFGRVESRGIDFIPPKERHSKPRNLGWVMCAPQFALGIMVFGSLPLAFGLGWWAAFWAITLGVLVGSVLFGPMALIGPRTGTNNCVSSGAFFGVAGRFIGSVITMFIGLGFFAILVWTGGQALIACLHRLFGLGTGNVELALAMAFISLLSFVLAIYGHATLIHSLRIIAITSGIAIVIAVIVLAPKFHALQGSHYLLGTFWPTWVLSFSTAASVPISWGPFINDYGRYVPEDSSPWKLFNYAGGGMFLGCWVSLIAGAFVTTTALASTSASFVFGFFAVSPTWLIVLLTLTVGGSANIANAAMGVYNAGLDMHAVVWRVRRSQMTFILSGVGLAVALIGVIVFNAIASIEAFVTILLVTVTPWMVINVMGHFRCAGNYSTDALQAFSDPKTVRSSPYWYTGGFNLRAVVAWAVGTGVGMLFVSTTIITGPLVSQVNGIDLSFTSAGIVGGLLYFLFVRLFPEAAVTASRSQVGSAAVARLGQEVAEDGGAS